MALDRSWYNTLKNDSGTNKDGTLWRKEDVDALMDAIDAELARVDAQAAGNYFDEPYNADNFIVNPLSPPGGSWTVGPDDQITFSWMVSNQVMWVWIYLDTTTVVAVPTTFSLLVKIPGGYKAARKIQSIALGVDNGEGVGAWTRVTPVGGGGPSTPGPEWIEIGREDLGPWHTSDNNTAIRVRMAFPILVP